MSFLTPSALAERAGSFAFGRWRPGRHRPRPALGSLVTQMLVLVVLSTLVPLGVSLQQVQNDRQHAQERAAESVQRGARLAASDVSDLLGDASGAAHVLEQMPAFWSASDDDRDRLLASFGEGYPYFDALLFTTPDIQEHGHSSRGPGAARLDLSGRAYAREALATGVTAYTDTPIRGLGKGNNVLPIAIPVRPDGGSALAGLLIAGLRVDRLPNAWSDVPLPDGSTTMLLDTREGRVLTANGDAGDLVGQTIGAANLDLVRDGVSPAWITTPLRGGQSRLRAVAPIDGTPWAVVVDVPASAVLGPSDAIAARQLATAAVAGGAVFGLLMLVWRRLASRVGALRVAARQWGRGDWQHRVGMSGTDEFAQLAATFDRMADDRLRAEAELRRHAEQLQAIIQAQADIASADLDPRGLMTLVAERAQALTGASGAVVEQIEGEEMVYAAASGSAAARVGLRLRLADSFAGLCARRDEVLVCADAEQDARVDRDACRRISSRSMIAAPLKRDGQLIGVLEVLAPTPDAFGPPEIRTVQLLVGLLGGALGHVQTFAERLRAEAAARAAAERFEGVLRAATEFCIYGTDLAGRITVFNAGAERMLGYTAAEVLGTRPGRFHVASEIAARAAELGLPPGQDVVVAAARRGEADTREWTFCRKDGSRLSVSLTVTGMHGPDGDLVGYIGIATDITERKRTTEALAFQARHDVLTGLGNRLLLRSVLEQMFEVERRYRQGFALLVLDLDGFKEVNDTLGHQAGDDLLVEISRRLRQAVRPNDTVARLGGDEFAIVLPSLSQAQAAVGVAERVLAAIDAPVDLAGRLVEVTASVGIALAPDHGGEPGALLRCADVAMYAAKRARSGYAVFDPRAEPAAA